ncbi:MAG TPA: DUF6069 family protein, partial [Trebonia sp.]|nr:DUF6069 family protein [Trebonia sp.]
RPDAAQFWAGAVATAVVAALIALVGILICRWTLHIPILAPAGDGAWGNAHTGEYALVAALVAIAAGGILYLLALSTPQPGLFFRWIMGLAVLAAVVYPFSTGAPVDQKVATAIVDLVIGLAIISLLTATAARAMRRAVPPSYAGRAGYVQDRGYAPGQEYAPEQVPGQRRVQPTRVDPTQPIDGPPRRTPRR